VRCLLQKQGVVKHNAGDPKDKDDNKVKIVEGQKVSKDTEGQELSKDTEPQNTKTQDTKPQDTKLQKVQEDSKDKDANKGTTSSTDEKHSYKLCDHVRLLCL
jgi:hypothetical protein